MTALTQFRDAIAAAGLPAPEEVIADGRIHRFPTNGRRDDDAGWYILHDDGVPAGEFGDWRTGLQQPWCARSLSTLTAAERFQHRARVATLQRQREEAERRQQAEAARRATDIWNCGAPAQDDHPYLVRKHVRAHGLRLHDDARLIVPLCDVDGTVWSLEFIAADGEKRFLPGGRVRGCCFWIGESGPVLCVAEGFATAATVYEVTGHPVVVAFSAGNLLPVAQVLCAKYPAARILLLGDHDVSGVGQTKAREAADAVGAVAVIPEEPGHDWNDVARIQGRAAVQAALEAALTRPRHILDELHAFLRRFVVYPSEHAHVAHSLWCAHTHVMDAWESTPRLAFLSPEPTSGKTRALEVTQTVVPRPVEAVNATSAFLFRRVSDAAGLPTILYDEIDTIFGPRAKEHEDIRGLLNAGHRRGAMAGRCVIKGRNVETEELPAFCAVALAGLGQLPDTILTRSVLIRMQRRAPAEQVESYRRRLHAPQGNALRSKLAAWASRIRPALETLPPMPEGITDRDADVWEALLSVADAAGGNWPKIARVAAVALVADAKGDRGSLGVRLLADLRKVFKETEQMATSHLLSLLHSLEEAPWSDLKGKSLDSRRLANLLKPYGVRSKVIRIGNETPRGYEKEALWDAWARYLPPGDDDLSLSPHTSETSATSTIEDDKASQQEDLVLDP